MALLTRTTSPAWANNAVLTAAALNAEFDNIINGLNGTADINVINVSVLGTATFAGETTFSNTLSVSGAAVFSGDVAFPANASYQGNTLTSITNFCSPIGTILPFYDFDANVTFDANIWAYCDGSTVNVNGSSQTLPDLSNRYLVGFGTEANADMHSATWNASAIGNASHAVNVSHTHTGYAHTHTTGAHNHNVGKMYIAVGPLYGYKFYADTYDTGDSARIWANPSNDAGDAGIDMFERAIITADGSFSSNDPIISNTAGAGTSGSNTGTTGQGTYADTSNGSALTIQPRSIKMRWIMRIA